MRATIESLIDGICTSTKLCRDGSGQDDIRYLIWLALPVPEGAKGDYQ